MPKNDHITEINTTKYDITERTNRVG